MFEFNLIHPPISNYSITPGFDNLICVNVLLNISACYVNYPSVRYKWQHASIFQSNFTMIKVADKNYHLKKASAKITDLGDSVLFEL